MNVLNMQQSRFKSHTASNVCNMLTGQTQAAFYCRVTPRVMELGTTLPKTWPTFLMNVLTCVGLSMLGRSAQIAILWVSSLRLTATSSDATLAQSIINPAYSTAKKTNIEHFKYVTITKKSRSPVKFGSFFQTTLKKSLSFLASITFWLRTGTFSPACSRKKTSYSAQRLATSTSINCVYYTQGFRPCQ